MIYILIQIVLCLLTLWYSYFSRKEKDLLNPVYLFTLIHIYLFVLPPIFRPSLYYNPVNFNNDFAKIIGIISYITFMISYYLPIRVRKLNKANALLEERVNVITVISMTVITFLITLLIFIYKVKTFGSISYVMHNSFEVMNVLSKGKWFLVVLGSVFLNSYYLYSAYCYENFKGKKRWISIVVFLILTIIISGIQSRSTIISLLIIFVIYENYKGNKLKIKHIAVVGGVAIIAMFVLNILRQGISISKIFDIRGMIASFLVDTNPYENLCIVLNQNMHERVWFKYLVLVPISFIPRVIWPGKPETLFEQYMMDKYIHYPMNGTMTFTLPGSLYFNIGVVGIIIGIIIYSRVFKNIYVNFAQKSGKGRYLGLMMYFILIVALLNGYRFSLEGIGQNLIFLFIIYTPFLLFNEYLNKSDKAKKLEEKINRWIK